MLAAAGKGERRNLRGSARLSSKMSGRLPRLRALRPRSQQQRTRTDATRRSESNLKETASYEEEEEEGEEELDAKRCDEEEKKAKDTGKMTDTASIDMANEMDDEEDDDGDNGSGDEVTMTAIVDEGNEEATSDNGDDIVDVDIDVDVDVEMRTEEGTIETTNEQASYECKSCKPPRMLPDIKAYLEHLRKEHKYKGKNGHNPVENRCPTCSLNVKDLETHQRVHHLKRKFFRCAKCDYMTHIRARYTKHVKYHSMPMIKCDACDFSSAYKWNLERHMRNHGGGGAFKCRACNFTADIRQSLTVHESYHHDPPVSHVNRKSNNAFERKPRNSPKRYNQVGASDFRAALNKTASTTTSANSTDSFVSDHSLISIDDKRSALANAECIALKCEEKGCQFITAWDSEMQRHLAECHAPIASPKPRKPLPRLIPLSLANSKPNNTIGNSGPSTTLLKVPRVRVRPELAQIARDTELAKMYGNKEAANSKRDLNTAAGIFERKNASFFDKLKEKLTTSASINNNGVPEVAVEGGPTHPTGRRVFKCPHCPFWASTASRFHVHIVGHLNRKPFECSMCAYRSNWRWDITKHIKLKAAKDAVHTTARVLMTDETGRRNYSKYNKYLAQVEQQPWDEDHMEERSIEEANSDGLASTKLLIVDNNKEYVPTIDLASQSPVTILSSSETNQNGHNVDVSLRPPPPLKAAIKSRGQSLLKNNPITYIHTTSSGGALSISTATDESKRIQWKCKRCNFRDFNKDTVLLHVKSHYESADQEPTEERNPFGCGDCPFSAPDAATLSLHRMHHRPNLEAIFKCYLCPYYVSTKAELLEHARLHGEELAAIHQQNMDSPSSKGKLQQVSISDVGISRTKNEASIEQVIQITSRNNVTTTSKAAPGVVPPPPPPPSLLLDTRALPDAPLVWVSRPDGTLTKMLKCRHCPYVSSRRAEVRDHETMHVDTPAQGPLIACTDCSFTCARREIMIAHTEMHAGSLGTVHCLVDETRPDSQQASDLATLLGMTHTPVLGTEPDLHDSRLVHCCGKCPARFLCEKELRIHLRYHTTELAHSCQWCSYAARQSTHLLAHQKAHSSEYQERTKYLLSLYGHSQRYPPPATACVEAGNQESNNSGVPNVAWIVVEINENANNSGVSAVQRTGGNQVFTCAKCPARYFRLDALEYHMTLHGSNNRFKCNDCDYSSKTAQNLVKHQVVHRRHNEIGGETIATASSTTAAATSSASVSAPVLSVQPPPDPQFGIFMRGNPNFVYQGYLRNGRLKEKRYKCHKCPSAFEKREQYRVHLTLHGAKQRYRCDTCDYSVKYYANFIQHLKKHQANAEAQASRRQFEDEHISVDNDSITDVAIASTSSRKSSRSSVAVASSGNNVTNTLQPSNQDKQSLLLMQKKGIISATGEPDAETIRCLSCPFSTTDKDVMDAHKRRHGIERMTPPCPHCDYIPRKDENIGEHIKLHFTRLYKPESYLIVELLTLMMEKVPKINNKEEEKGRQRVKELLFKECADGRFLPLTEPHSLSLGTSTVNKKRVIVDPNTGETKNNLAT
ncbi:zinc finger protein 91 isoform X4 [Polyergus mexicanus]|uniref:zinc finger protein 91 isoform X4 n=1 Tax=Polyergus mexicanus TaxID=615972 RepID=UPI0038B4C9D3